MNSAVFKRRKLFVAHAADKASTIPANAEKAIDWHTSVLHLQTLETEGLFFPLHFDRLSASSPTLIDFPHPTLGLPPYRFRFPR